MAYQQLSTRIRHETMEELRDAVSYLQEESLQGVTERALQHELRRMRKRAKVGERFPERHGK